MVKDESGVGIEGVSVVIPESKLGSITNEAGKFSIGNIELDIYSL